MSTDVPNQNPEPPTAGRHEPSPLGVVGPADRGTPAQVWDAAERDLPELDTGGWSRVIVVAPHPDDEVLGLGGLIAALAEAGCRLRVVTVTDGESAYAEGVYPAGELGEIRAAESAAGCAELGVRDPLRLGIPDGAVARHEDYLSGALIPLLSDPRAVCLTTWRGDGHPDHEAAGRAAAEACARTGAALLEYPVWMWHWATPGDARVPWGRAVAYPLGEGARERKRRAIARHASQLDPPAGAEPVLPEFVLERLITGREVLFR